MIEKMDASRRGVPAFALQQRHLPTTIVERRSRRRAQMGEIIRIVPEPARPLTLREECEVLRVAVRRKPDLPELRQRLARLLNQIDAFDECIALLGTLEQGERDYESVMQTVFALFAREAPGDNEKAEALCKQAVAMASTDRECALALADEAKALNRQGRTQPALNRLEQALAIDPRCAIALKRYAGHLLETEEFAAVLALTEELQALGVTHCRLFATRAAAFGRLGRIEEARELIGLDFVYRGTIEPPAGWTSLSDFNATVAGELTSNPGFRFGRYGTASEKSWRVDTPAAGRTPAIRALLKAIAETAERHVASLSGRSHPWISVRPVKATLHSWSIITEADGHENIHLHSRGWMSGTYYPLMPAAVVEGTDKAGCFAFAVPENLFGKEAARAIGETLVRPHVGLLTFFPSHAYHRTYPHGAEGRRICISLDIAP
jgi:Flp pilus assembly protein TadD